MSALRSLVADELSLRVDPRVEAMAAAIAAEYRAASRAVLFYGSCLRSDELEGQMLDFYLIVNDYRAAYGRSWLAIANRIVPPNVFPFAHGGLSAKYAVMSAPDFARDCGPEASTVSVWARFAQPARLVWTADAAAGEATIRAVARCAPTLLGMAEGDVLDRWRAGLTLTYAAELRAERGLRPGAIVDADPARYLAFGRAALAELPAGRMPSWSALRWRGKALSAARLAKASLTFAGGIDYLAWKVNRHAGTAIAIKPWQRRWPIVAGLLLLPKLLRGGAIR